MRAHLLKTWPQYYAAIENHSKTFEIRVNDRDFKSGDPLCLAEYDPDTQQFTGRFSARIIGYLIQGEFGLPSEVCVMSLLRPDTVAQWIEIWRASEGLHLASDDRLAEREVRHE